MASSLAAAIQNKFGVVANLIEGHHGIYEVAVNGDTIYSNQSKCCSGFPSNDEIFQEIRVYTPALPGMQSTADVSSIGNNAPNCKLPANNYEIPVSKAKYQANQQTGCGCQNIPIKMVSNNASNCCGKPAAQETENLTESKKSCCG